MRSINWSSHAFPISKRWTSSTTTSPTEATRSDNDNSSSHPESAPAASEEGTTGTRYFLHLSFVAQWLAQVINAFVQHRDTPAYFAYIILLHGPVLLFIIWIAQIFQEVFSKRFFSLQESTFDSILTPIGGVTMHSTRDIAQDVKVASMIPVAYAALTIFWLCWYTVLDKAEFDETVTNGVTYDELESIRGLFANISAQAMYLCLYLAAIHIIVPLFPLSSASFLAACLSGYGLGVRRCALIMDSCGFTMSLILWGVGMQQTIFDDQNGIGIFVWFNATILMIIGFKRSLEPIDQHALVLRSCYSEKEEDSSTVANGNDPPTSPLSQSAGNQTFAEESSSAPFHSNDIEPQTFSESAHEDFEELELV